jgi:hypothetical protein
LYDRFDAWIFKPGSSKNDEEIIIEALDDALLDDSVFDLNIPEKEAPVKSPRKRSSKSKTPELRKSFDKSPTKQDKTIPNTKTLQCSECGILLSNNVSMRRHIERVQFQLIEMQ